MKAIRPLLAMLSALALSACASMDGPAPVTDANPPADEVQILALNDFHGHLLPQGGEVRFTDGEAERVAVLGGVAQMGATLDRLREGRENTITVAAGDLIGASPIYSAYFLDEPSIAALGDIGLDLASVGNHEFDRGIAELRRMQDGGCEQFTAREPCALDPFAGAQFTYLAANVVDAGGQALFPGTAIRDFGPIKVGFIGMTLRDTPNLVSADATAGYRFLDEAETANTLAARLRGAGADEVVVLIHEGGWVDPEYNVGSCPGLNGGIEPILAALDPAIRLIVSGHTHNAYVCHIAGADGAGRLLTSAGRYGYFVTDIRARIDPATRRFASLDAANVPVSQEDERADLTSFIARYVAATAEVEGRVVGMLTDAPANDDGCVDEWTQGFVADAQLSATIAPEAGASQFTLINSGAVRTTLAPAADGGVTFGQIYSMSPFGNTLMVVEMTGAQIRQVLEQQFCGDVTVSTCFSMLIPSGNFSYAFDRGRPAGERIGAMMLDGAAIDPDALYRVTINNYLQKGGDGFSVFAQVPLIARNGAELDAIEAYLGDGPVVAPTCGRVRDITPDRL